MARTTRLFSTNQVIVKPLIVLALIGSNWSLGGCFLTGLGSEASSMSWTAHVPPYPPDSHGRDGWHDNQEGPVGIRITSPTEGELLGEGPITVTFEVDNYTLAPRGNHFLLVIDNAQPIERYNSEPYTITDLKPGSHTIRVMLSRPWGTTWKNQEAYDSVLFHVGRPDNRAPADLEAPLLTYARPSPVYHKGTDTRVPVDFWVSGCNFGPKGCKVRYSVDGHTKVMFVWHTVWLENLAPGEHEVVLELLDADGNRVPGKYNRIRRLFRVD